MAAAVADPCGRAAAVGEQADSDSELSSGIPEDSYSSGGEALDGDDEDETAAQGNAVEEAASSEAGPGAGWADAMAKVLNKAIPRNKSTILAKNKSLEKEREKEKQERLEKRLKLDKKREWEMMCRVKPDVVKDRDTERNLQRIATRGVVQLFNAVRTHQKNIDEKVKKTGSSDRQRAKLLSSVSKKDFISVLRNMDGAKGSKNAAGKATKSKQGEVKSEEGPEWNILRDDFMMGASMKDWDKESDGEGNTEQGGGLKQDDDSD
ncbi:RRP15-like protein [Falco rusticolus]|uniref:RRP15-like protein n=1 Tax=Falco rusticolus TaxID=120794 RepID=UPI00188678AF|nr:RRP15-like protein [Falco rusticolus]XP_055581922.1 RRP15-like protein [Falco cherrug]